MVNRERGRKGYSKKPRDSEGFVIPKAVYEGEPGPPIVLIDGLPCASLGKACPATSQKLDNGSIRSNTNGSLNNLHRQEKQQPHLTNGHSVGFGSTNEPCTSNNQNVQNGDAVRSSERRSERVFVNGNLTAPTNHDRQNGNTKPFNASYDPGTHKVIDRSLYSDQPLDGSSADANHKTKHMNGVVNTSPSEEAITYPLHGMKKPRATAIVYTNRLGTHVPTATWAEIESAKEKKVEEPATIQPVKSVKAQPSVVIAGPETISKPVTSRPKFRPNAHHRANLNHQKPAAPQPAGLQQNTGPASPMNESAKPTLPMNESAKPALPEPSTSLPTPVVPEQQRPASRIDLRLFLDDLPTTAKSRPTSPKLPSFAMCKGETLAAASKEFKQECPDMSAIILGSRFLKADKMCQLLHHLTPTELQLIATITQDRLKVHGPMIESVAKLANQYESIQMLLKSKENFLEQCRQLFDVISLIQGDKRREATAAYQVIQKLWSEYQEQRKSNHKPAERKLMTEEFGRVVSAALYHPATSVTLIHQLRTWRDQLFWDQNEPTEGWKQPGAENTEGRLCVDSLRLAPDSEEVLNGSLRVDVLWNDHSSSSACVSTMEIDQLQHKLVDSFGMCFDANGTRRLPILKKNSPPEDYVKYIRSFVDWPSEIRNHLAVAELFASSRENLRQGRATPVSSAESIVSQGFLEERPLSAGSSGSAQSVDASSVASRQRPTCHKCAGPHQPSECRNKLTKADYDPYGCPVYPNIPSTSRSNGNGTPPHMLVPANMQPPPLHLHAQFLNPTNGLVYATQDGPKWHHGANDMSTNQPVMRPGYFAVAPPAAPLHLITTLPTNQFQPPTMFQTQYNVHPPPYNGYEHFDRHREERHWQKGDPAQRRHGSNNTRSSNSPLDEEVARSSSS
ncbi:unnamed protein product, partial [Mesorhabditis spiculigera]